MKLLRLAPLAVVVAFAACSGAPTAPALSIDSAPVFDSGTAGGGNMVGSGNRNDDSGGFGSGNLDSASSTEAATVPADTTTSTSLDPNMMGSGN